MEKLVLDFQESGKSIAASCSSFVKVGDSFYAGGDEGVCLARLQGAEPPGAWCLEKLIDLRHWFDLPLPDPVVSIKANGKRKETLMEVDVEGLDFDPASGSLWVVGSHSWKRKKAEFGRSDEDNLLALKTVAADGNRFLLGRVPLREKKPGQWRLRAGGPRGNERAAQVACSITGSELLDALRDDPLFMPFLQGTSPIPGKDNGLDIEGIACIGPDHVLIGLRGPVMRGISVLLELRFRVVESAGKAARLLLEPTGPDGRRYRRHFLDLCGHGVRDLCWDGKDLLILAGPAVAIDSPPNVYRWSAARKRMGAAAEEPERFVWKADGEVVRNTLRPQPVGLESGRDRAESLASLGDGRFLIGYDTDGGRLSEDGCELTCDVVRVAARAS